MPIGKCTNVILSLLLIGNQSLEYAMRQAEEYSQIPDELSVFKQGTRMSRLYGGADDQKSKCNRMRSRLLQPMHHGNFQYIREYA